MGIGWVLHQIQQGKEKVIAYASRALNRAESNYCITEKELLAVNFFVEYFRQYLLGRRFIVRSDHQSLVWLFKLKEPRGKIAKWIEVLRQYDFVIQYRPGKNQGHCYALSRCENPKSFDDTMETLKCGPCKKCFKHVQYMLHVQYYKEIVEKDTENLQPGKMTDTEETVTSIKEAEEAVPGTSVSTEELNPKHRESKIIGSLFQGSKVAELAQMQENDPDISIVLRGKLTNTKPSSQEMTVKSPAVRHYWIL